LLRNGENYKKNECWHMVEQKLEVVSEIKYLGIKLESSGSWRRLGLGDRW
jgi:hypothetical protein